jgi:selenocysteine-specific elongation factor
VKRFRLAVDRVFTLSGVGVVATGTVLSGSVHLGDRIQLSPSGLLARVRSLHAQNRPAEAAHAGERCALNLTGSGITKDAVRRGDVELDPKLHAPTDDRRASVFCRPRKPIGHVPVRLHHAGPASRIVLFDDEPIAPGEAANVSSRPSADRRSIRRPPSSGIVRRLWRAPFLDRGAKARGRRTLEARAARCARAGRSVGLYRCASEARRSLLTLPRSQDRGSPPERRITSSAPDCHFEAEIKNR